MADFIDLLKKAETDPDEFRTIVGKSDKLLAYDISSAELAVLSKLDTEDIKLIANRIAKRELASSQACQACADREMVSRRATR